MKKNIFIVLLVAVLFLLIGFILSDRLHDDQVSNLIVLPSEQSEIATGSTTPLEQVTSDIQELTGNNEQNSGTQEVTSTGYKILTLTSEQTAQVKNPQFVIDSLEKMDWYLAAYKNLWNDLSEKKEGFVLSVAQEKFVHKVSNDILVRVTGKGVSFYGAYEKKIVSIMSGDAFSRNTIRDTVLGKIYDAISVTCYENDECGPGTTYEINQAKNYGDYIISYDGIYDLEGVLIAFDIHGRFSQEIKNIPFGKLNYILSDIKMRPLVSKKVKEEQLLTYSELQNTFYKTMEAEKVVRGKICIISQVSSDSVVCYQLQNVEGTHTAATACLPIANDYLLIGNKKYGIEPDGGFQEIGFEPTKRLVEERFSRLTKNGKRVYNLTYKDTEMTYISNDIIPIFSALPIDNDYSLVSITNNNVHTLLCDGLGKPVIYVYDYLNRKNSVTLKTKGTYTYLEPLFTRDTTWDFVPTGDGGMFVNGVKYDYLRYKLAVKNYTFSEKGWIIKGSDIKKFYDSKLSEIGFTKKETYDFMDYRVNKYSTNKEYFITFKFNNDITPFVALDFAIKPTTLFRVLMETQELNSSNRSEFVKRSVSINDNSILKTYKRSGILDVMERGGVFRAPNNDRVFHK